MSNHTSSQLLSPMRKLLPCHSKDDDSVGADPEKRGNSSSSTVTNSPLASLRCLLNFYCALGVIPGRLSKDACTFSMRCCHNLKGAVIILLCVIAWSVAELCVGYHPENEQSFLILLHTEDDAKMNSTGAL